jgi:hypothetical protein
VARLEIELSAELAAKATAESGRTVAHGRRQPSAEVARQKAADEALGASKAAHDASTGGDDARRELDRLRQAGRRAGGQGQRGGQPRTTAASCAPRSSAALPPPRAGPPTPSARCARCAPNSTRPGPPSWARGPRPRGRGPRRPATVDDGGLGDATGEVDGRRRRPKVAARDAYETVNDALSATCATTSCSCTVRAAGAAAPTITRRWPRSPRPSRGWSRAWRPPRARCARCASSAIRVRFSSDLHTARQHAWTLHKRSSKAEIEDLIRARYSLVQITSAEETRVEESLRKLCVEREMRLEVWSITEGFKTLHGGTGTRDVKDPMKALDHVLRGEGRALYVLRDFHPFLKEPAVVRRLRDVATELRKTKKTVAMLSPVMKIPPELEKSVAAVLDWELPTRAEIEAQAARNLLPNAPPATQQQVESDPTFMERVVEGALGLTLVEAENVFAKSMVRTHTFDLETILEEKKQIIRKSGLLEYYEQREEFSDVGGMEILKDWLVKRRNAFSSRARDFGLPLPKGILLIGVPGTGKSLTAKAVGALWQMPLLRLDVGKIFGGLVGSSEENMRSVIKTAEAIAPAILWIDELEKGFSGTAELGPDRRRHHLARVRLVHHLAAGEDLAGVRDRHRQQRQRAAARAAAQGPLRRDLLL